jgi:hypothetical protein
MSLLCKIFGHKYVLAATDLEGMCEVICTRCSSKARWPRAMLCKRGEHDWKPVGVDHFERLHIDDNRVLNKTTMRTWKCRHCRVVKQDEYHERVTGVWYIVDGEFIHEDEVDRKRFKITENKV